MPTTNTTLLILLRIGLALTVTLTALLALTRYGNQLPLGTAGIYIVVLAGATAIATGMRALLRDLDRPLQASDKSRRLPLH